MKDWIYPMNLVLLLLALPFFGGAIVLYVKMWTAARTHFTRETLIMLTFPAWLVFGWVIVVVLNLAARFLPPQH